MTPEERMAAFKAASQAVSNQYGITWEYRQIVETFRNDGKIKTEIIGIMIPVEIPGWVPPNQRKPPEDNPQEIALPQQVDVDAL